MNPKVEAHRNRAKKCRLEKHELRREIFGETCFLCGKKIRKRPCLHRLDGRNHPKLYSLSFEEFEREVRSGKYVQLHIVCHSLVHKRHVFRGLKAERLVFLWRVLNRTDEQDIVREDT